ncbi:MAG: geranylgeranylglyceryl/heptaprenylglyceryl phosphate synthase [Bacteroidales bacterium]|nr:geranylgeranylglyceryl/heptaprenylglyceryl phosphate synthase [Bacteroidales bacterium]
MIYNTLLSSLAKKFALLIDPDNQTENSLVKILSFANTTGIDFIMVGGSLVSNPIDQTVEIIKNTTTIPVVLFPGSLLQLSEKADAILLLALISGRNPDYLIGNHVLAAHFLKKSGLEIIPTGYILIDGKSVSSVEYISNTRPIPIEKADIVVATALAGEMLGHKMIYLEAGSGADRRVSERVVAEVKKNIRVPLMVGGGIRTPEDALNLYKAGADIIVVGSAAEDDPEILKQLVAVKNKFV